MDLNKYKDTKVRVKFIGGRQIVGVLKGFDQLMNLVLEEVEETLRGMYNINVVDCIESIDHTNNLDPEEENLLTKNTRHFRQVVVRGPSLLTISPLDGSEVIDNPFAQ